MVRDYLAEINSRAEAARLFVCMYCDGTVEGVKGILVCYGVDVVPIQKVLRTALTFMTKVGT